MLATLYRRLLIPSFESGLKGRSTFAYVRDLERTQWCSLEELRERQLTALMALLGTAYENCPYYRSTWDRLGLDPRAVRSVEDFSRWPLLRREDILENRDEIRTTTPGIKWISKSTGGSSGTPLHFAYNADSDDRRVAASHRGYGWANAGPGTRSVFLWGVPLGHGTLRNRWKDWLHSRVLYRRTTLNTFDLSEETLPVFLRRFNRAQPDALVAYVNPLFEFARGLERRGLEPHSPRSIVVGAEKLHGFQRETIERVFRAPVFETYGSREFMLIGAECEHHAGLHLTMEHLLVEVVDDEGRPTPEGEVGNVVVTDLYNIGMPFIRYVTGDRAVAGFGQCACGRGLPLLREVVGRQLDMITTPDGRRVPGEFFPHLFKDHPAIRRFQVVQDEERGFRVKLVVDETWNGDLQASITELIRRTVGEVVEFEFELVDEIPLTGAGKLQVVVNRCRPTALVEAR